MNAVARGLPTVSTSDESRVASQLAMRRSRARSKARADVIGALVDVVAERADAAAETRLRLVSSSRPSGHAAQLARAQVRADAYLEILDTILPLIVTEDATPDQLYRTVRAVIERIVADYVQVST